MEILVGIFWLFAKLSLFSFGGGFVMVPPAIAEIEANHWATAAELTNTVAIATMAPGPVGVNLAVGLGYKVGGLPGAGAAFLGITLPTTVLVVFVALFFFKIYKHPLVSAAFYGLRPAITGIILYAAISLALKNGILFAANDRILDSGINVIFNGWHFFEAKSLVITAATFFLLAKNKLAPLVLILISGIIGIMVFSNSLL